MGYVIHLKGLDQHHSNTLCFTKLLLFNVCYDGNWEKYIDLGFVLILLENEWDNVSFSSTTLNFLSRKKLRDVRSSRDLLIHVLVYCIHSMWSKNKLLYTFTLILPGHISFLWFISLVLIHGIPWYVKTWGCIYELGFFRCW